MYIKDLHTGLVRKYGTNRHDSLRISNDGRFLTYENLQCGDGSRYGDYRFVVDEEGHIPKEDEVLAEYGADAYFNIGGFGGDFLDWLDGTGLSHEDFKRVYDEYLKDRI